MKKNSMILNTLLAIVLGVGLLVSLVWKTYMPNVVLPNLDAISMVGITLIALVLEYYIAGSSKRVWVVQIVLAALTFGGLGWAADLPYVGILTFVYGAFVFGILTWIFDSIVERMEITINHKYALIPTVFVLYLACQCFMGMF